MINKCLIKLQNIIQKSGTMYLGMNATRKDVLIFLSALIRKKRKEKNNLECELVLKIYKAFITQNLRSSIYFPITGI